MKPLPIRWKFALWAGALVALALVVYSCLTLLNLYNEQLEAVDQELVADGRRFATIQPLAEAERAAAEMARFEQWLAYAFFDESGALRYRGGIAAETARAALATDRLTTVREGAKTWRIGAFREGATTCVIAYDLAEVHQIIHGLVVAYALSLPLVVLIAAVGGWWISGRALGPVRELTAAAERVQAASLDQRVPVSPAEDELQRLATVLNAMLARLEKSFEQAQRFAADASHELRTPLTVMRGEIERLLRAAGMPEAHEAKLVSLQEEIDRLQRIAENLLLLARLDAGHAPFQREPLDLGALVHEACEDAELLGAARGIGVEERAATGLAAVGDAAHLRRALLNLLDNAVKFSAPGGTVRCTLAVEGGLARCAIANTGPGVPEALRPRLFERFFRADASRGTGGHGLGLSLSREIARAHGGDLVLAERSEPGWTEFVLTLPLAGRGGVASA